VLRNGSNHLFDRIFRNSFGAQALNSKVGRILLLSGKALIDVIFMVTRIMKKEREINYFAVNWNALFKSTIHQ
jgi:hypothetical protein